MNIQQEEKDGILVLSVQGRLDSDTSPLFLNKLTDVIDDGEKQIIIDLAELEYINSVGFRALVLVAKKTETKMAKIVLARMKSHIKKAFDITGFTSVFPLASSLQEAHVQFFL